MNVHPLLALEMGLIVGWLVGIMMAIGADVLPSPIPPIARRAWRIATWKRRKPTIIREARRLADKAKGDEYAALLLVHDECREDRRWVKAALPCALAEYCNKTINAELGLPEDFGT